MCFSTNKRQRDFSFAGPNKSPRVSADSAASGSLSIRRPLRHASQRLNTRAFAAIMNERSNHDHTQADHDEPIIIPSSSPTVPPPAYPLFDDSTSLLRSDLVFAENGSFIDNTVYTCNEPDSTGQPHAAVISPGHDVINNDSQAEHSDVQDLSNANSADLGSFGEIDDLLRDPDVIRAMDGPCITPVEFDHDFPPIRIAEPSPRLSLLNLSPLTTPPPHYGADQLSTVAADEDHFVKSAINKRLRPRRNFYFDFWQQYDNIINSEYPQPSTENPLPILSRAYTTPVRICNPLSLRKHAGLSALQMTDSAWSIHARSGELNLLQKEVFRLFDHSIFTLDHLPQAMARNDLFKVLEVIELTQTYCTHIEHLCREDVGIRRRAENERQRR